jgi:hypothetical protein
MIKYLPKTLPTPGVLFFLVSRADNQKQVTVQVLESMRTRLINTVSVLAADKITFLARCLVS